MLGVPIIGGFEGYLVEDPVLEEGGHKCPTLGVLDWRLQLGQLLLVQFQGLGGRGAVALQCELLCDYFCMECICLSEDGHRNTSSESTSRLGSDFEQASHSHATLQFKNASKNEPKNDSYCNCHLVTRRQTRRVI